MKSRVYSVLGIAALLVLAVAVLTMGKGIPKEGDPAPDFELKSISGEKLSLEEIRKDPAKKGKTRVVLLDFWSTGCPPCREEAPELQKLHKKYEKKGLAVVGVALEGTESVKPFVKAYKLDYTIVLDPDGIAARKYGIRPIPTTYIIDKKGIIRHKHIGFGPGMEKILEDEVKALLK